MIPGIGKRGRQALVSASLILPVIAFFLATTKIVFKGHYEGIFLLKGKNGYLFELKDDIYLGDGSRLLFHLDASWLERLLEGKNTERTGKPYLDFDWEEEDGSGYVMNVFPGKEVLFTSFSRYVDSDGLETKGLFVGGGLSASVTEDPDLNLNDTGMAFHDGRRWYHLWCSVNEAIASGVHPRTLYYPSGWRFLGSKVLKESDRKLILGSRHEVAVDGVPLEVERYANFEAGEPYFKLSILISNRGSVPARYYYLYGDDPWVGNYGTSEGNVGWVKDRLVRFEEAIDPKRYSWAGMFDYGNSAAGVPHGFTGAANFIEWLGGNPPDTVYFSNRPGGYDHPDTIKVPLTGDERFIGLVWGPRVIAPGKTDTILLAVGMAWNDPETGFPVKPEVKVALVPW